MKIVIPMSEGEKVSEAFVKSFEDQTIKCEIIYVKNPITFKNNSLSFNRSDFRNRSLIIADSRNLCLPKLCEDEVSVMQNSSLIHENKNNVKDMYDLLMSDEKIAAVALAQHVRHWFPLEYEHIKNGCVMARKNVWQNIKFEVPEKEQCTCLSFNRQVRKIGIYRFLDLNNTRVSIKKTTINN
jgi:hypothetical protein